MEITKRTKELLLECKDAGYERITIFVHDKRVPDSVQIRKGSTGWNVDEDGIFEDNSGGKYFRPKKTEGGYPWHGLYWGLGTRNMPFKIICGAPNVSGDCIGLPKTRIDGTPCEWPAMWGIIKGSELAHSHGSCGSGNGHEINDCCCGLLTAGYYDLSEIEQHTVIK